MKRAPSLAMYIMFTISGSLLSYIDPQPGQSTWTILGNLAQTSDDFTITIDDPVGGTYTVSEPGNYLLSQNSTGKIVVDTSDASINLNCYELEHNNKDESVITVNSGKKNVRIFNGKISNSDATPGAKTGAGILVEDSSSLITIDEVQIFSCGNGVKLDGQPGNEVCACKIIACDFSENTTAVFLYHADKNSIQDCYAQMCTQAGYVEMFSKSNCFFDCSAVETFGDSTCSAFKAESGSCNMFKDCAAKSTKTNAFDFCSKSCGFLITGTEEKTKIINCVVNETDMTSTVSAVAYGIHLDPTLLEIDDLLLTLTSSDSPEGIVRAVAWSPDSKYVASGDLNYILRVFIFDGSTLVDIAQDNWAGSNILSVSWSPDGKYIATGDFSNTVRVFRFDGANLTRIASNSTPSSFVYSVAWSPNSRYIAAADNNHDISVYSFDGISLNFIDIQSMPGNTVNSIAWSPNGKYLAAGDNFGYVGIFSFNGSTITYVDQALNPPFNGVVSVKWSPNGKFIATGDRGKYVRVFGFNGSKINHISGSNYIQSEVLSVAWSPNGKYIAGSSDSGEVGIFGFDGSTLTPILKRNVYAAIDFWSIDWSSCGRYLVSGDDLRVIRILSAMHGPQNCLIKSNSVADTNSYGQFVGTGISGSIANNGIICNSCCNNEVNYTFGIPNTYDMLTCSNPNPSDNIESTT